jgi:hypothetical protein
LRATSGTHAGRAVGAAAALYYFTGFAFGISNVPVATYFLATGHAPVVFGVELDGGGPFDHFGSHGMALLIAIFIVVCALEVLAARWISQRRRRGGALGALLLPVGAAFWYGFALPLPWLLGATKAILLSISWRDLRY